jgi:hypothetical protein
MSAALAYHEKRQFGRRKSDIRGRAMLPGQAPKPFTIVDISDGGARLRFDEPMVAPRALRIEIDGTDFDLQCEVRHQGSYGVGVRFMRSAEGVALNAHFREKLMHETSGDVPTAPARIVPAVPNTRGGDLRQVLREQGATPEPGPEPDAEPADAAPAPELPREEEPAAEAAATDALPPAEPRARRSVTAYLCRLIPLAKRPCPS